MRCPVLIDESAGPNACHPWLGDKTHWLHDAESSRDLPRVRDRDGHDRIAQRVILAEFFNVGALPDDVHVHQECGDRLCCNLSHQLIGPAHGGAEKAVPAERYFADRAKAAA